MCSGCSGDYELEDYLDDMFEFEPEETDERIEDADLSTENE